ncbi:Endonuclease/exonuclease/phosphatase superfamily [Sesbania bispinosa]|nr:Endonuclease/exonuclease/phosphatase superfamily [Sesbania bispinosa]
MSSLDNNVPKFTAKLSVPPAKSIMSIAQENGFWKHKGPQQKSPKSRNSYDTAGKNGANAINPTQDSGSQHEMTEVQTTHSVIMDRESAMSDSLTQKQKGKAVLEHTPLCGWTRTSNVAKPFLILCIIREQFQQGRQILFLLGPICPLPPLWCVSCRKVSHHNSNFIQAFVEDIADVKNWEVTFLYGNPTFNQRRHLWSRLQALRTCPNRPWTILGDFNELLFQHEKEGLHPHPQLRMDLFRQFVNDTGLMDLELKGCRERLDRVMVNWEWRALYPNVMALAVPAISSDHTPIIFCPKPRLRSGRKFKFEMFWEEHQDCSNVIQDGWTDLSEEPLGWGRYLKKTKNCKSALQRWHNKTFRRADYHIFNLNEELQQLLNADTVEFGSNWERIQDLRNQIDSLRRQEGLYWAQRSRIKWLQYGDMNSIFSHASIVQRRDRNKLFRLKDNEGIWVEGQQKVEDLVLEHYREVYKSGGSEGVTQDRRRLILNLLQVQEWENPGRYLGLPAEWGR